MIQTKSNKPLLELLLTGNSRTEVNNYLSEYKEQGIVDFKKVLQIPSVNRIPELIKKSNGRVQVLTALAASLKSAFSNLNMKYGFNEDQIVELADKIIDTSHEDNLSIEDVLLFLQKMLLSEYGKLDYKFDIPFFFEIFENYRLERRVSLLNYRDEQAAQHKAMGRSIHDNFTRDRKVDAPTMLDLLNTLNTENDC